MSKVKHNITGTPPDSDAVALMRTFESLKSQLEALATSDKEARDAIAGARINFDMAMLRNEGIMENNHRQRRELEAKFHNVRELLTSVVGRGHGLAGACAAIDTELLRL